MPIRCQTQVSFWICSVDLAVVAGLPTKGQPNSTLYTNTSLHIYGLHTITSLTHPMSHIFILHLSHPYDRFLPRPTGSTPNLCSLVFGGQSLGVDVSSLCRCVSRGKESGASPFGTLIRRVCGEYGGRNPYCPERVRSVRVFRDRLSGGWASGNWGRIRPRVHPFPTILTRSSTDDALVKKRIYGEPTFYKRRKRN